MHIEQRAKTKIVATVGPASQAESVLEQLIVAGVNVFRLNMAHGSLTEKEELVRRIRGLEKKLKQPVGILCDLGGPKIRLTALPGDTWDCADGAEFRIVRGKECSLPNRLAITYDKLLDEVVVGDKLVLADGTVHLRVVRIEGDEAVTTVEISGQIRSKQGVNLPGVKLSINALTPIDREHAVWAAGLGVDFLGMSFVRNADEVSELQAILKEACGEGPVPKVIAKIEKAEALHNLESIIQAAGGVMVARGDLGVEIDLAMLAVEQKRIIGLCQKFQKPCITATQMLESMIHNSMPTRAEATDVANAILDGTDACMLSGETAVGNHPVQVVKMMNRIALATEPLLKPLSAKALSIVRDKGLQEITNVVVHNAARIAEQLEVKLILVATHSGLTALAMAKQRCSVPVIAVSDSMTTVRQACLYWGVKSVMGLSTRTSTELLVALDEWGRQTGQLSPGDKVVMVASTQWTARGHNTIVVHEMA